MIDTTLASDNTLCFSRNLLERLEKQIVAIDDQIIEEKLQYAFNGEAAKISELSSSKTDKYEYLESKEILPPDQIRVIEQAKFTYSPLEKALEIQIKTIQNQGEKQIKAIEEH